MSIEETITDLVKAIKAQTEAITLQTEVNKGLLAHMSSTPATAKEPAPEPKKTTAAAKKAAKEPEPEFEEEAEEEPAPAPKKTAAKKKVYTKEDLVETATAYNNAPIGDDEDEEEVRVVRRDSMRAINNHYGIERISVAKPSDYAEIIETLMALGRGEKVEDLLPESEI